MQWFKTVAVGLGLGRIAYVAWNEQHRVIGDSKAEALSALAKFSIPEGFVAEWQEGGLDADDAWRVTHPRHEGLRGYGGTPQDAVADFECAREIHWYPSRFRSLEEQVILALERSCMPAAKAEFQKLIRDIRDGSFKYEG